MLVILIAFGFLPVIAYLVVGTLSTRRAALWSALAVGALECGYVSAAGGRLDLPVLLSLGLLAVLVTASQRTGDDFWFRIHGALLASGLAFVLLVAWYGFDRALLLDIAERQHGLDELSRLSGDPRLTPDVVAELLRLFSYQLPWWLLIQALLTLHAASNWGKWGWAMVRLPGFLLMFILASAFTQGELARELGPIDPASVGTGSAASPSPAKAAEPAPAGAP